MEHNYNKYLQFREKYPEFHYQDYHYKETEASLELTFDFCIPGLAEFHPTWSIHHQTKGFVDRDKLEELIFSLGMVELVSYWKITCAPKVVVEPRKLSKEQIVWWKKLYLRGLGEFFYTNGISPTEDFMEISCKSDKITFASKKEPQEVTSNQVLVPIGGGKDSAVTLELLKGKAERVCYIINPRQATLDTVKAAELTEQVLIAKRSIDKQMLELNQQGFLNGHTPFSAIVAFSSVITAYLNGIPYVALSNESSANEATVQGTDVNHQYSKSFEFECDFRSYEKEYIHSGVWYFSLLRPLTELQIAKLFSSYQQYHAIFRSCNVGSKTDIWCGHCPKCLFVAIILSPFLSEEELVSIFGKNMLNDETLKSDFEKLIGLQSEKPFECVGSRDEVCVALGMTLEKYRESKIELPVLLKYYSEKCGVNKVDISIYETFFDEQNAIPEKFLTEIKKKVLE